jgi:hypothetical protein
VVCVLHIIYRHDIYMCIYIYTVYISLSIEFLSLCCTLVANRSHKLRIRTPGGRLLSI